MARILVVDDDRQTRIVLRRMLEAEGHEVIEAENGDACMRSYAASPADLVVVDMFMPERDGLETIVALRREFAAPRIIAISGGGGSVTFEPLEAASHLGALTTLTKPVDAAELAESVRKILATED